MLRDTVRERLVPAAAAVLYFLRPHARPADPSIVVGGDSPRPVMNKLARAPHADVLAAVQHRSNLLPCVLHACWRRSAFREGGCSRWSPRATCGQ
jgi:hypothetical protein